MPKTYTSSNQLFLKRGTYTKSFGLTPLNLASLLLWLDAADTSTITSSGGAVSQWNDKSGNGNNVIQGTGALQPVTGSNTQNGHNVITFDGARTLQSTASGLLLLPNGANTVFVVANSSIDNAVERIVHISTAGAQRWSVSCSSTSNTAMFNNGNNLTNSPITKANYNIITGSRSGVNQFISFNNGTEATNALAVDAADADLFNIGSARAASQFLTGNIAEIIIYNRLLSAGEKSQINNYLKIKWGTP